MLTADIAGDLKMNKPDIATKDALARGFRANTRGVADKSPALVIFGRRERRARL
ncbi:hypothetical protein [Paraburkholderia panacisoli]|uniref:hypothetical protein n=1 Tax=Paraburkholderia panacisoli TaxID=2603818 RepID=UPI00165FBD3E|nr:hypothetical protein [Paraburkholderia panacisoli]